MKARKDFNFHNPVASFRTFEINESELDYPYHFHEEYELVLVTESSGTRIFGDNISRFQPFDLCLIGSNLPHLYRACSANNSERCRSEILQFSADKTDACCELFPEFHGISNMLELSKLGLQFSETVAHCILPLMRRLRRTDGVERVLLFWEILLILSKEKKCKSLASIGYIRQPRVQSEQIGEVCTWISRHFQYPISHRDLAKLANLSPSAFSRQFKRVTGHNAFEFINLMRLGHASRLLQETDDTIASIAFASGFENLSNFNRRFKENYGQTPKQYRSALLLNN